MDSYKQKIIFRTLRPCFDLYYVLAKKSNVKTHTVIMLYLKISGHVFDLKLEPY